MSKQLRAALLTWRNPVALVHGLFWLLLIIGAIAESRRDRSFRPCHPTVTVGWDNSLGAEALVGLYKSDGLAAVKARLANVEELRIDARWTMQSSLQFQQNGHVVSYETPPGGLISLLPECTRLRRLSVEGMIIAPENLQIIGSIHQLEELAMARSFVSPESADRPPVLAALTGLRRLKKLDLSGTYLQRRGTTANPSTWRSSWHMDEELQHLAGLPELRTLILVDFEQVTGQAIRAVSTLPQVETLAIDMIVGAAEKSVTEENVAQLQSMPNLRTLYVPHSRPYQNVLGLCRELLPDASVRRGTYDSTRIDTCRLVVLILLVTVLAVVYQLVCSLLCSVAATTPQFHRFHLCAAGIISGVSILICLVLLLYHRSDFLSAVSLCLVFVSAFALVFSAVKPAGSHDAQSWRTVAASVMLGGGPGLMMMSFGFLPHWFDAWLAGDFLLFATLLIVGSLVVLARVPSSVRKLTSQAMESGMASVAGFSDLIQAQQQRVQRLQQKRQESGGIKIVDLPADLDAKLRSLPVARNQRQLALLRAGSGLNPRFLLVFGVITVFLGACMAQSGSLISGTPWDGRAFLKIAAAPLCMVGLIPGVLVVGGWRNRMSVMSLELLRPVSRKALRRMLFQSVALDLAPVFVLVFCLATGLAFASGYGATTLAIAALFASIGPLLYGVGLWIILIHRTWVTILIGIVLLLVWQLSTVLMLQERPLDSNMLLIPTAVGLIIGLSATGLAWRYWPRREMV